MRYGILGPTRAWRDDGSEISLAGLCSRTCWCDRATRFRSWFVRQNYRILPYLPFKGMLAASARKTASAIELKAYA